MHECMPARAPSVVRMHGYRKQRFFSGLDELLGLSPIERQQSSGDPRRQPSQNACEFPSEPSDSHMASALVLPSVGDESSSSGGDCCISLGRVADSVMLPSPDVQVLPNMELVPALAVAPSISIARSGVPSCNVEGCANLYYDRDELLGGPTWRLLPAQSQGALVGQTAHPPLLFCLWQLDRMLTTLRLRLGACRCDRTPRQQLWLLQLEACYAARRALHERYIRLLGGNTGRNDARGHVPCVLERKQPLGVDKSVWLCLQKAWAVEVSHKCSTRFSDQDTNDQCQQPQQDQQQQQFAQQRPPPKTEESPCDKCCHCQSSADDFTPHRKLLAVLGATVPQVCSWHAIGVDSASALRRQHALGRLGSELGAQHLLGLRHLEQNPKGEMHYLGRDQVMEACGALQCHVKGRVDRGCEVLCVGAIARGALCSPCIDVLVGHAADACTLESVCEALREAKVLGVGETAPAVRISNRRLIASVRWKGGASVLLDLKVYPWAELWGAFTFFVGSSAFVGSLMQHMGNDPDAGLSTLTALSCGCVDEKDFFSRKLHAPYVPPIARDRALVPQLNSTCHVQQT